MTYASDYAPLGWSYQEYLAYSDQRGRRLAKLEENLYSRDYNLRDRLAADIYRDSPCNDCADLLQKVVMGAGLATCILTTAALAFIPPPEPVKPVVVESTISKLCNATWNLPNQAYESIAEKVLYTGEQALYAAEVTMQVAAVATMVVGAGLLVKKCITPELRQKSIQFVGKSSLWLAKKSFSAVKATVGGIGTVVKNVAVAALSH
jgi:hypothetical protein